MNGRIAVNLGGLSLRCRCLPGQSLWPRREEDYIRQMSPASDRGASNLIPPASITFSLPINVNHVQYKVNANVTRSLLRIGTNASIVRGLGYYEEAFQISTVCAIKHLAILSSVNKER
jgi:hypothetical protein